MTAAQWSDTAQRLLVASHVLANEQPEEAQVLARAAAIALEHASLSAQADAIFFREESRPASKPKKGNS